MENWLSSLWKESMFSFSNIDLLYHHICTNVHALTSLPVKSAAWSPNGIMASAVVRQVSPHLHPLKTSFWACHSPRLFRTEGCAGRQLSTSPHGIVWTTVFNLFLTLKAPDCLPAPRRSHVCACWGIRWSISLTFVFTVVLKQVWEPFPRKTHKIPGSLLYSGRFPNFLWFVFVMDSYTALKDPLCSTEALVLAGSSLSLQGWNNEGRLCAQSLCGDGRGRTHVPIGLVVPFWDSA